MLLIESLLAGMTNFFAIGMFEMDSEDVRHARERETGIRRDSDRQSGPADRQTIIHFGRRR